jgi:ADP-heptose:LPS heptosyltransferase
VGLSGHWLDQFLLTKTLSTTAGGERRSLWGHLPFVASIDEWITAQNLILDEKTPTILPNPKMLASVAKFLAKLPRPIFVVNLFAADAMRRWSLDHANSTLQLLMLETGGSLILNSGPDAISYHSAMFEKWSGPADQLIDNLPNPPSMERDVALYHLVDGYIGVNSFTANLALNCNVPAIVLYNKASDILRYRSTVFPAVSRATEDLSDISAQEIVDLCVNMLREMR